MTVIKPKFLLVPPLYEEGTAVVLWENTPQAEKYELDISFNEDFDSASRGKSWADMELRGWRWTDQAVSSALSWKEMAQLLAQGLMWRNLGFLDRSWGEWNADSATTWRWIQEQPVNFTIYSGPGEDIAAPDQGRTWANINSASTSWAVQNEGDSRNWKEIELLPSIGLTWYQHRQDDHTWEQVESAYDNWRAVEVQPTRGLCWSSLGGRWRSWEDIHFIGAEQSGMSWRGWEYLPPDNQTHKGTKLALPLYTKASTLRVRAQDEQGNDSDYLTTAMISHRPRSLARYKVPCLHVPALYEGRTAELTWGDLYGASAYVLERKLSGSYETRYNGAGRVITHPAGCGKPEEHYYGPDCKRHLSYTDPIPYGQKAARYRIKGYNTTDGSQYVESSDIPIIPVFYRDDSVRISVTSGSTYLVQLYAEGINNFDSISMRLNYDPTILRMDRFVQEKPQEKTDTSGQVYSTNVRELSQASGQVRFQCIRQMKTGQEWHGLLVSVCFKALQTGAATITVS